MTPHYADELRPCACGCGASVWGTRRGQPRRFVTHHNLRVQDTRTPEHRASLSAAARRVWSTKRKRKPLGSTHRNVNGYLLVKVGLGARDWRPEHIVVVERQLGRSLSVTEHVHHINGIRTDNRLTNLHVFATNAGHGAAHGSLSSLLEGLLADGAIVFDRVTGRYRRP